MNPRRSLIPNENQIANLEPALVREFVTQEVRTTPQKSPANRSVGMIAITVRLRPEIANGLKRASLERQLAGETLFTQQDMVESALEPWLKQQGFL